MHIKTLKQCKQACMAVYSIYYNAHLTAGHQLQSPEYLVR
jgi:hypothetical protein